PPLSPFPTRRSSDLPTNCSDVSLVPIVEAPRFASFNHRKNVTRGETSLLDGDGRHPRQRLSGLMWKVCQVTDDLNFGMAGNGKIIVHNNAADPINWLAH